jgi:alkylation response protein AidB-like acyl-CoA dehydrogenase
MVYRAASQAEQGLDFTRTSYLAHRQAIKVGMKTGTDGVQLLGGHGFTREHPVELWYRNLRALQVLSGMAIV